MICLTDPEGIVDEPIVLSPSAFFVASMLDGLIDVTDIQYLFFKQSGGQVLSEEVIRNVVDYLDLHGYLQSPQFEERRLRVREEFARCGARPSVLAGKTYPESPDELRSYLDSLFLAEKGPGQRPARGAGDEAAPGEPSLRAMVVPHIDLERGGPTYAHGYLSLAKGRSPETVFLFGVAHAGPPSPFILTKKDFETPLGTLRTDVEIVAELSSACSWDALENELVHRSEHSIEFQVLMLAYLFGAGVRIVPILCGGPLPGEQPVHPSEVAEVGRFLDTCRGLLKERDGRACVIAGADLAHVGKRFGDPFDIDESVIEHVEARDREDLAFVTALDADGWYRSVMKDANARRVCGLNCIYATLKSVEGLATRGELLHYDYAPDAAGGIVSFAGIAIS